MQQKHLYQSLGTSFLPRFIFFSPWRSQSRPLLCQILAACHQLSAAQGSHLTEHKRRKQSQLKDKAILRLLRFYFNKVFKTFGNLLFRTEGKWYTHTENHSVWNTVTPCNHSYIKPQGRSFYITTVGRYIFEVRNHLFSRCFNISVDKAREGQEKGNDNSLM